LYKSLFKKKPREKTTEKELEKTTWAFEKKAFQQKTMKERFKNRFFY